MARPEGRPLNRAVTELGVDTITLSGTIEGEMAPSWSPAELAAIDALRGVTPGTLVVDEFVTADGESSSQTSVVTEVGAVVLMSYVPEAEIPASRRTFIRQHVNHVRRRLNLPAVAVRHLGPPRWDRGEVLVHEVNRWHPTFDREAEPGMQRMLGAVTSPILPWTISLHVALSGDDLVRAIAHELRHVDQLWGRARIPEDEREPDAIAFADAWMDAR